MTTATFGELLRAHRGRTGMTQRELADAAGMSTGAIRDLEQGRTRSPKRRSVQAVVTALGLSQHDAERLHAAATAAAAPVVEPADSGPLRIRVLGPVDVWHGDVQGALGSGLQKTLLARLALDAGNVVGRDELIELLWRHGQPRNAGQLHTQITRLRRLLDTGPAPAGVLVGGPSGYRLAVGADNLDLLAFRDLVARASRAAPEDAFTRLTDAIALWRGDIDAPRVASTPPYIAVRAEYATAVQTYAALARGLGRPERALPPLRDLARRRELDEPLHAELVLTLAANHRQAEALAAYDRIRSALADQLGVGPGEQLRSAHLAVVRQRERRSTERQAVCQAPAAPLDFVGREDELASIEDALTGRPGRVVLINGIAGVGKTSLALAAARRLLAEYPDGQLYADLRGATSEAAAPDPMPVLGRFLRALGVPSRRIGTNEAEAAALLRSELAGRRMLVLLDNARDSDQVRPLLPGAGDSDVIVTSRRRMPGLAGLDVIDLEPLTAEESVALITATVGAHRIDADPVAAGSLAEACARLPLALRIASARLATRRAWTVEDMASRLRDDNRRLIELSTGESSVLSSFQFSYADLSPAAQRAFRLCALHPGDDFGADSTAVLLGTSVGEAERVLEDLLEANVLLQYTADRYRFHDLLGLYARGLLADDGEADSARSRLYAWYADAVTAAMEWAYPQVLRLDTHAARGAFFDSEAAALAWLDVELPALVAVVAQSAVTADPALSWRITDQLRGYFMIRRHVDGWLPAVEVALAAASRVGDDTARTAMLISRCQAFWSVGRDAEALSDGLAGEGLAIGVGWTTAAAYLAHHVAWIHMEQGRLAEAEERLSRALELTEEDKFSHVRAVALNGLGVMRLNQGELRDAVDLLDAALEINEATGRETSALANRGNLASALRQLGEETRAADLLTEVLAAYRDNRNVRGELSTLDEWSELHVQRGAATTALDVAEQAHDMALQVRDRKITAQTAATVARAHLALGDVTTAIRWFEDCLAIADDTYPFIEARALTGLGLARLSIGDPGAAAHAAERAVEIARARGFRLLEEQAVTLRRRVSRA